MRFTPRAGFAAVVVALSLGTGSVAAAAAQRVTDVVAAVGGAARFSEPAQAAGTLTHTAKDGTKTSRSVRVYGRRSTVRIEDGSARALVRRGRALVARADAEPVLDLEATFDGTSVLLADLGVLTPRQLGVPHIVDQGLSGTVIASGPIGASPYALVVHTIDPERHVVTQVKYYQWSINNMVRRERRSEYTDVAGGPRPGRITVWDIHERTTTELVLEWRAGSDLPHHLFTPAGLRAPAAP